MSEKKKKSGKAAKNAYGQKKERVNVALTPDVVNKIDNLAQKKETSRSELIETTFRQIPEISLDQNTAK